MCDNIDIAGMFERIRKFENAHILLWLIKDSCWMLQWKAAGVAVFFPTVVLALYIAYVSRKSRHLFIPNLAVCCWILANGMWMLGEFWGFDFVLACSVLFGLGLVIICYHFISNRPNTQH